MLQTGESVVVAEANQRTTYLPPGRPGSLVGLKVRQENLIGRASVPSKVGKCATNLLRPATAPTRMNLLLLGPPASGKGTQAHHLTERLGIPAIATGNILRNELAQGTELGLRARAYMQRGDLVPDALMIDIIRERLRQGDRREGFLLDGFPRTVAQAQALDALVASVGIAFDRVLYLKVPELELIRRITSRLTCSGCGLSYFVEPDQPRPLSCEADGMALVVREDDRPKTAERRIAVYLRNTLPVLDHYRKQGLVAEVDGIGSVAEVSRRMLRALPARPGSPPVERGIDQQEFVAGLAKELPPAVAALAASRAIPSSAPPGTF